MRRHPQRRRLPAHRRQRRVRRSRATSGCTSSSRSRPDTCEPEWVDAEHPLFILYTSGSTGKPKGVQHSTGGYLLWAMLTMKWTFDIKPQDVFWCTADIGWVTGHTYIAYGPLAVGATEVVFEGVPTYPDAGRFWETIAKHKVTIFYTAPTAIRSLIKASGVTPSTRTRSNYDLSSLRLLGTVGEPINPEAWMWYHDERRRRPLPDRRHVLADGDRRPHDHAAARRHGDRARARARCRCPASWRRSSTRPGTTSPNGQGGILVIKRPWPSMIRTIWGDPERFKKTYYPEELGGKLYLAGDGSVRDKATGVLHDHGPHRRRAERLGPSARHDGDRVGAGRESDRRRGGRRRPPGRHDRRGDLRVRRAEAGAARRRRSARRSRRSCATGSARRSARSRSRRTSASATTCRRRAPARSCGGCCARSRRARTITQDSSTLENPAILDQLKQAL